MKFSENPDYGFAVGRVRAKEILLIKRNEYERMLTVRNEDELLSTVKGVWRLETTDRETNKFEHMLTLAQEENRSFFAKYCIDKLVKELFSDSKILKNGDLTGKLLYLNNEFLNEYFKTVIDLENIRSLVRIKNLAEKEKQELVSQRKRFNQTYLKSGMIPEPTFANLLSETWEAIIHWSGTTPYQSSIEDGINYLITQKSFLRLERLIEEEKQRILILARYATFGYEPLVAYYLFKENEIKNLRKTFYGISEKTATNQIRESIACIL